VYRLFVGYGKQTCEAVFNDRIEDVDIEDIDVMDFYSKAEGWKFIRHLQKTEEHYCFLTLEEYRHLERLSSEKTLRR
jgi:hypothetical protein